MSYQKINVLSFFIRATADSIFNLGTRKMIDCQSHMEWIQKMYFKSSGALSGGNKGKMQKNCTVQAFSSSIQCFATQPLVPASPSSSKSDMERSVESFLSKMISGNCAKKYTLSQEKGSESLSTAIESRKRFPRRKKCTCRSFLWMGKTERVNTSFYAKFINSRHVERRSHILDSQINQHCRLMWNLARQVQGNVFIGYGSAWPKDAIIFQGADHVYRIFFFISNQHGWECTWNCAHTSAKVLKSELEMVWMVEQNPLCKSSANEIVQIQVSLILSEPELRFMKCLPKMCFLFKKLK